AIPPAITMAIQNNLKYGEATTRRRMAVGIPGPNSVHLRMLNHQACREDKIRISIIPPRRPESCMSSVNRLLLYVTCVFVFWKYGMVITFIYRSFRYIN